jgi:hypothetical protein
MWCRIVGEGGKATSFAFCWDRERGLAGLGLAPEAGASDL